MLYSIQIIYIKMLNFTEISLYNQESFAYFLITLFKVIILIYMQDMSNCSNIFLFITKNSIFLITITNQILTSTSENDIIYKRKIVLAFIKIKHFRTFVLTMSNLGMFMVVKMVSLSIEKMYFLSRKINIFLYDCNIIFTGH